MKIFLPIFFGLFILFSPKQSTAQLVITGSPTAQQLAQKLIGEGITISNVTFTGNATMAGIFNNQGGTNIGIDSGIILTNGLAKSDRFNAGVNGDGFTPASQILANKGYNLPGSPELNAIFGGTTRDACILEFDFVPQGDSIKFKYVFSSEEYVTDYVCDYNDAFAFLISGPGFPSTQNLALIPNTNTPVSIFNVNNITDAGCVNNPTYYVNNSTNNFFTHNGHTVVLTAEAKVEPCQTYHLKIIIADGGFDDEYDSGVFIEAKSLTSNNYEIVGETEIDPVTGSHFIVEGCADGIVNIKIPRPNPLPQTINLSYTGTAVNGVDVELLPSFIVIPAGEVSAKLVIKPLIDNIEEGIESFIINVLAPCSSGSPIITASSEFQIRDYNILNLTPDTSNICRNSSLQLSTASVYDTYTWDPDPTLSSTSIPNPVATPTSSSHHYYLTTATGTCNFRDSIFVQWKEIESTKVKNTLCANATTGEIEVFTNTLWSAPVQYSINNINFQASPILTNLPIGDYTAFVKDATGCIDSTHATITQLFPDLESNSTLTVSTCSATETGSITMAVTGGKSPYTYSYDNGASFGTNNVFITKEGSYSVIVKDANNCIVPSVQVVLFNKDLTLSVDPGSTICESKSVTLNAVSNGETYKWTPAESLSDAAISNPVATPTVTTKYYIEVQKAHCISLDSVTINVNPAPLPNAGTDRTICFGGTTRLNATGGKDYVWTPVSYLSNPNISNPTVTEPTRTITYTVNTVDANGCASLSGSEVTVEVTPPFKLNAGRDTLMAIGQKLALKAVDFQNVGVKSYLWNPSTGLTNAMVANPIATITQDVTYKVVGTTNEGCKGEGEIKIKAYKGPEIYVPNAFTPNGDGLNDLLKPTSVGMKSYRYFKIYNRLGQVIYSSTNFAEGWDGRLKGMPQASGIFIWVAEAIDIYGNVVKRTGNFILIR